MSDDSARSPKRRPVDALFGEEMELTKAGTVESKDAKKAPAPGYMVEPPRPATVLRPQGKSVLMIDGPFAESRELIVGFSIWEVKDMDEAVAWVKRCPNPMPGPSEIEIRYSMS